MTWNVVIDDCNKKSIENYNVLKHEEKNIQAFKNETKTFDEFCKKLETHFRSRYWSRCEYELMIEINSENHIILSPLFFHRDYNLDVTDRTDFDWRGFAEYHIKKQIYRTEAKIDIWDQIEYRWDAFSRYCYDSIL